MIRINSKHLMFIIWGTSIVSMKTNITSLLTTGQRDTWIAIFIASIFIFFYILYVLKIMSASENYDIISIYKSALGKFLGFFIISITILSIILVLVECASVEASAMHTNLFLETPVWYLILFFAVPAIYTIKKGLYPIMTVTIIGVVLAMLAGINLVILTSQYKEYKYLLPILANGITTDFIYTILKAMGFYGSTFLIFPFIKYLDVKSIKSFKKYTIIGFLIVIQMHVVSSIGAITSFGIERAVTLAYPKLIQTQEINYLGFIESGELFVMFQIVGGWFVKYVITFFVLREFLKNFKLDNSKIIYLISITVMIVSYLVSNKLLTLTKYLHYYTYWCLIIFIIVPALVFTIYKFKSKNIKKTSP